MQSCTVLLRRLLDKPEQLSTFISFKCEISLIATTLYLPPNSVVLDNPSYSHKVTDILIKLTECTSPLGMEDGRIKGSQITTSGVARGTTARGWQARLNRKIPQYGAWCANVRGGSSVSRNYDQYIQIDLMNLTNITGIATQGRHPSGGTEHVKDYSISYSKDSLNWTFYIGKNHILNETKV